ncbi:MAG: VCBS repeat-containing protein, partial [Flavobacteriales bacterium]|nr:VCBS repeat-containing protein [Flavobacteriales bacterium]
MRPLEYLCPLLCSFSICAQAQWCFDAELLSTTTPNSQSLIADLNEDGLTDVVQYGYDDSIQILWAMDPSSVSVFSIGFMVDAMAISDLNNDGHPD